MEWQRRPTWHKPGRSRPPSPQPCRRPELINAIGLLLGEAPRTLEVARIPRRIPVSLPGAIVRRRPDVREAWARLHEATAQTGVAVASFYPDVTLNGAATVESLHLSNLFSPASAAFAMGPSISIPIFEGGQLRGALALSESHSGKRLSSFRNESCGPGSRSTMP